MRGKDPLLVPMANRWTRKRGVGYDWEFVFAFPFFGIVSPVDKKVISGGLTEVLVKYLVQLHGSYHISYLGIVITSFSSDPIPAHPVGQLKEGTNQAWEATRQNLNPNEPLSGD